MLFFTTWSHSYYEIHRSLAQQLRQRSLRSHTLQKDLQKLTCGPHSLPGIKSFTNCQDSSIYTWPKHGSPCSHSLLCMEQGHGTALRVKCWQTILFPWNVFARPGKGENPKQDLFSFHHGRCKLQKETPRDTLLLSVGMCVRILHL